MTAEVRRAALGYSLRVPSAILATGANGVEAFAPTKVEKLAPPQLVGILQKAAHRRIQQPSFWQAALHRASLLAPRFSPIDAFRIYKSLSSCPIQCGNVLSELEGSGKEESAPLKEYLFTFEEAECLFMSAVTMQRPDEVIANFAGQALRQSSNLNLSKLSRYMMQLLPFPSACDTVAPSMIQTAAQLAPTATAEQIVDITGSFVSLLENDTEENLRKQCEKVGIFKSLCDRVAMLAEKEQFSIEQAQQFQKDMVKLGQDTLAMQAAVNFVLKPKPKEDIVD